MNTQKSLENIVWVHPNCVYWIPELGAVPGETCSVDFSKINKIRYKLLCSICKTRGKVCLQCSKGKCQVAFHVECARNANLSMETYIVQGKEIRIAYCEKHRPQEIRKLIEQTRKTTQEEVANFCRVAIRCLKNEEQIRKFGKYPPKKKKRVFTKTEKKTLMKRVREIHRKYSQIYAINIEKTQSENTGQISYSIIPPLNKNEELIKYEEIIDRRFPWDAVKFGKFTEEECLNKFIQIVPDAEIFTDRLLLNKYSRKKLKRRIVKKKDIIKIPLDPIDHDKEILKKIDLLWERPCDDYMKYCFCQKMECETVGAQMIECSGGDLCPGNNWYHYDCLKLTKSLAEIQQLKFFCKPCKERLGLINELIKI